MRRLKRAPGIVAATSLVMASMIGTGVFTSLGYQLHDLSSAPQIMLLWLLGGMIALCGAFSYAAVARQYPGSGGEYHFLTQLFHPALGFMAGLLSVIVGFAAPAALSALAFAEYLHKAVPEAPITGSACAVILVAAVLHSFSAGTSAKVQLAATGLKVGLIFTFLVAGLLMSGKGDIRWQPHLAEDLGAILHPAFAVALFFVFYSYSGWNAAVYGLEDWDHPTRTMRYSLLWGTGIVTLLYLGLNAVFLHAAPVAELRDEIAVGEIAARNLFGSAAGKLVALLFATGLFASVSAMLWAGPHVLIAMGRAIPALRLFASPRWSLGLLTGAGLLFVLFASFRNLVLYTQTGLIVCTLLVALGVYRLPRPRPVLAASVFLLFTLFVIVRSVVTDPVPTLGGLATAGMFILLWIPLRKSS